MPKLCQNDAKMIPKLCKMYTKFMPELWKINAREVLMERTFQLLKGLYSNQDVVLLSVVPLSINPCGLIWVWNECPFYTTWIFHDANIHHIRIKSKRQNHPGFWIASINANANAKFRFSLWKLNLILQF